MGRTYQRFDGPLASIAQPFCDPLTRPPACQGAGATFGVTWGLKTSFMRGVFIIETDEEFVRSRVFFTNTKYTSHQKSSQSSRLRLGRWRTILYRTSGRRSVIRDPFRAKVNTTGKASSASDKITQTPKRPLKKDFILFALTNTCRKATTPRRVFLCHPKY